MDSNEYVLKHDFGYGREPELDELIKLELRNIEDVKVYVADALENAFINYKDIKDTFSFINFFIASNLCLRIIF